MSKILILIAILLTGCSKPMGFKEPAANQELTDSISSIIFDSAKKTDQNAAEVFDLGSVGSSPIKKVFNISNTTGSNIALNFSDLQSKVSATTRFVLNLATATPCPASLKTNKSCSFELTLNKVNNESYDAIATNIIDAASRGANPEFGGMLFSGVKTNDVSSEVPLSSVMRIDRLADAYQVPAGLSVTKRFYIGNIGSTVLKTPSIVAPQDGSIIINSCSSLINIKPNGTCFFEIKYTSDLSPAKANYNTSITFTSTDPLVNTTGLKIDLAITNQPAVVPVVNANFNQVGSITDLSTANGKTRLYVNNTGSAALDTSTITIPAQYTVTGTSCPASLKAGKTCFYDLTINTAQTANSAAVVAPITIGTTTFVIKAGDPAIVNSPNPVSSCKAGFSMINGSCISSNVSQSCSANGGSGTQQSIDGGQNFSACQLTTCSDNRYSVSGDQLSCQAISCNLINSGIPFSTTVIGDLVSGCSATACSPGYSARFGECVVSNISQACAANGGSGLQQSIDGGQNFGACQLTTCSDNRYEVSNDQLSCQEIQCTIGNSNLNFATNVIGTKVSGCVATACSPGYVPLNGACSAALISQACTAANSGIGTQQSTDGGQNFGACLLTSCSDNRYEVSGDQLSCQAKSCTIANANILQAATVSGDLVSGCIPLTCQSGFVPSGSSCVAESYTVKKINETTYDMATSSVCYIANNDGVRCFGSNTNGQMGKAGSADYNVGGFVDGLDGSTLATQVSDIQYTSMGTCVIMKADNAVKCWGLNASHILGLPVNGDVYRTPTTLIGLNGVDADSKAKKIFISGSNNNILGLSCAITQSDKLKCWGRKVSNAGSSSLITQPTIMGVSDGIAATDIPDQVFIGGFIDAVVMADGSLKRRGYRVSDTYTLDPMFNGLTLDSKVKRYYHASSASISSNCILTQSDKLYCGHLNGWQYDGSSNSSTVLKMIGQPTTGYTCIINKNNGLNCGALGAGWFNGMMGLTPATSTYNSIAFSTAIFPNFTEGFLDFRLYTDSRMTCYVGVSKKVYCSGANNYNGGYLGDGNTTTIVSTDASIQVSGFDGLTPDTRAVRLLDTRQACALTESNKIKCWGSSTNYPGGTTATNVPL